MATLLRIHPNLDLAFDIQSEAQIGNYYQIDPFLFSGNSSNPDYKASLRSLKKREKVKRKKSPKRINCYYNILL